ncbi:MAG: peptidylprolyl isomerase [Caldiserica bacterium]|nr:MAG: peptidylprolyl isomerase [Caldisericota bacterium]RLD13601.1 MAG: peptidylprolyl isomerase [Caldisericota bacterium]
MEKAKTGDTVRVEYTGKFEDGQIFDSNKGKELLEFTLGEGKIIPGFEKAVIGMEVDEEKTVKIPPKDGYGEYIEGLVAEVEKERFPENLSLEVGRQLVIPQENGGQLIVTITKVTDSKVTLDANHPLAGKTLIFDIKLKEIVKKS